MFQFFHVLLEKTSRRRGIISHTLPIDKASNETSLSYIRVAYDKYLAFLLTPRKQRVCLACRIDLINSNCAWEQFIPTVSHFDFVPNKIIYIAK